MAIAMTVKGRRPPSSPADQSAPGRCCCARRRRCGRFEWPPCRCSSSRRRPAARCRFLQHRLLGEKAVEIRSNVFLFMAISLGLHFFWPSGGVKIGFKPVGPPVSCRTHGRICARSQTMASVSRYVGMTPGARSRSWSCPCDRPTPLASSQRSCER